ncbi:MAG: hypothetical protein IPN33_05700 [Saprospiraceae bacterium]|nr:hypothetical protein [Saprospiraceae bacterium]
MASPALIHPSSGVNLKALESRLHDLAALLAVYKGYRHLCNVNVVRKIDAIAKGQRFELCKIAANEGGQFGCLRVYFHCSHFQFSQVEYFVDQFFQLLAALPGHLQEPGLFVGQLVFF